MEKVIFLVASILVNSACSQSKNVYFNGTEGSNSGIKYESTSKEFSLN
ncbi:Uncharacterised protein [Actinobacillus ureae]|uniref:Transferrin-binding protein B C-lobe/N-lobe beta barrel domain-containing protein n=1 Tax=Actinobacillus ureae ATCC 25976 TaxID=887324 RepID=E8KHC3_9PAST|nr:hypothetical protein [Actinobacillus ureae]EFX91700.1 hypothetical protein HMPREF0027_1240 [Actinobacillus ureae ATCC 25976]SUT86299.1 Uncharacterised protein [Actinobacillus ureae]SUU45439.1 Uncharacterised protein [Actinobacillus ureae]